MRDIYRGPAVLVGPVTEYEVHAELWDDVEEVNVMTSDAVVRHVDGRRSWGGELVLSTSDTAQGLDDGVLRLPDGCEGAILVQEYSVAGVGDRLQVLGRGRAPSIGNEG
ncbi:hypothetical protein ACWGDE_01710 [Streptomyces sp. NPDC054956]